MAVMTEENGEYAATSIICEADVTTTRKNSTILNKATIRCVSNVMRTNE